MTLTLPPSLGFLAARRKAPFLHPSPDALPQVRPRAMESADRGLRPSKPRAPSKLFLFQAVPVRYVGQSDEKPLTSHSRGSFLPHADPSPTIKGSRVKERRLLGNKPHLRNRISQPRGRTSQSAVQGGLEGAGGFKQGDSALEEPGARAAAGARPPGLPRAVALPRRRGNSREAQLASSPKPDLNAVSICPFPKPNQGTSLSQ